MESAIQLLFWIGLILFFIAVIGHGIWVVAAAVLSGLFGEETTRAVRPVHTTCPKCGAGILMRYRSCPQCGWQLQTTPQASSVSSKEELETIRRRLTWFFENGTINRAELDRFLTEVQEEYALHENSVEAGKAEDSPVSANVEAKPPADVAVEITDFAESVPAKKTPVAKSPAPPAAAAVITEPVKDKIRDDQPAGGLLQAFMEEKNIRWGELISGMLIVGSSVGLVISLWSTLKDAIPYFPALLFMLTTAAIHGAGLYTLRRWKLKSTSRGLLLISTLLVPLNFLAAIALSGDRPASDPLYMIAVSVGILVYSVIAFSASRILTRPRWRPMWLAVMGPSIGQLIIARQMPTDPTTIWVNLLAAIPVLSFVAACGLQAWFASHGAHLTRRRTGQTFLLLGVALFSLLMAVGLLVRKTDSIVDALAAMSPLWSLASIAIVGLGLVVHQRTTSKEAATTRTTGTAIAIAGAALMLAGLFQAWPQPALLIAVGVIDLCALTLLAFAARLPVLHYPAAVAAALTSLVGLHWLQDTIVGGSSGGSFALVEAFWMGRSAIVLMAIAAVASLASRTAGRFQRSQHATCYLHSAIGLAGGSLLVALYAGFVSRVDVSLATPIFVICALAAVMFCRVARNAVAAWIGTGLAFITVLHGLTENVWLMSFWEESRWALEHPTLVAALLAATNSTLLTVWFDAEHRRVSDERERNLLWENVVKPFGFSAAVLAAMVAPRVLAVQADAFAIHSGYAVWMTLIGIAVGWTMRSRLLFAAVQATSFVAVTFAASAFCVERAWDFWDPRFLQVQLGTVAVWCAGWTAVRRLIAPSLPRGEDVRFDTIVGDRFVLLGAVAGTVLLSIAGMLPGLTAELVASADVEWVLVDAEPRSAHALGVSLAGGLVIAAFFGVMAATAWSLSKRAAAGLCCGGAIGVLWIAVGATNVTAASFARAFDASHVLAFGPLAWGLLAVVLLVVAFSLWERVAEWNLIAGIALIGTIPVLIAARFESQFGTATVLRWELVLLLLASLAVGVFRDRITSLAARCGFRMDEQPSVDLATLVVGTVYAIALVPIFGITLRYFFSQASTLSTTAVASDSLFLNVSSAWSYAVPLWVLAVAFCVRAFRERRESNLLAASFLLQFGVALFAALPVLQSEFFFDTASTVAVLQWNAVALAAASFVWMMFRGRFHSESATGVAAFEIQLIWSSMLALGLSAWAGLLIVASPERLPDFVIQFGSLPGLLVPVLLGATAVRYLRITDARAGWNFAATAATVCVPLLAAVSAGWNVSDAWWPYHVVVGGVTLIAISGTLIAWRPEWIAGENPIGPLRAAATVWAVGIIASSTVLMLLDWTNRFDPLEPWWSVAVIAVNAGMLARLAFTWRQQTFAYAATALTLVAVSIVHIDDVARLIDTWNIQSSLRLLETNLIAASLVGLAWVAATVYFQRRHDEEFDPNTATGSPAIHHVLGAFGLWAWMLVTVALMFLRVNGADGVPLLADIVGWSTWAAIALLLIASLWDRRAKHAVPGLFAVGLVAVATVLDSRDFDQGRLTLGVGVGSAIVVAIAAMMWRCRDLLGRVSDRVLIAPESVNRKRTETWLPMVSFLMAGLSIAIHFWTVLTFAETNERLLAAAATALLVPGFAAWTQRERQPVFSFVALMLVGVTALQFVWAVMPVDIANGLALQRTIRFLEVAAGLTILCAVPLVRRMRFGVMWDVAIRRSTLTYAVTAIASLLLVLGMEAYEYVPYVGVPISNMQMVVVSALLVGLTAALIALAVLPENDPLHLSEPGRTVYVYAAEAVLALLFLHVFLTRPEWFSGFLRQYWSYIVMAIAYVGVGVSEMFRRMKLPVLSEPLRWTGTFLPLLPMLAFWIQVADRPFGQYSLLLFLVSLMYVLLSVTRKSFMYSMCAALAGNAALWSFWHLYDLNLLGQPQLWLIPPALTTLIAAHINRERLSEAQTTGIRYLCVMMIYVSSTGEMFIAGARDSLWQPMILATFSVIGVFSGILLRVRAFLYLGSSFLLLAIISMVWHAARNIDHVWPWWVFGLVMGIAILVVFGLFEKKRDDVLRVMQRMKQWGS